MASSRETRYTGFFLVGVGVFMLGMVFYFGITAFRGYTVEVPSGAASIVEALTASAGVLIDLLVKVAFLGIALVAGSTMLSRGVDMLRGCRGGRES